jgi:Aerotolerance regulator N-terminal
MSFLQPWLLLALPLILVPIIIHLVNQWRYQTKPWAAMMFLLAAKSMHRGFAKLRQWLILAMRVLAVAGLIFAISRPLTTGIMGLVAGGRIDTTIIMIDRSPSMLQQGAASRESKLLTGLRQLRDTLATQPSSRWLLIDSAKPSPQEFATLNALIDSPISSGTSAISSWPAMFQSALEYIQANRPSQTNIWICSDMRQGDWQSQTGPWPAIREAFQKLPSQVRFFAIAYPAITPTNRALTVEHVALESEADRHEVVLTMRVRRDASADVNETVPIQLSIGGGRTEVPIELVNGVGELKDYRIPIDASVSLGWGKATIPADDNPADNEYYFTFDVAPTRETMILCEQNELVYPLQIAAEIPRSAKLASSATVLTFDKASQANIEDASLVIWQGPLPNGDLADRLQEHLDRGRTIWFLPSAAMAEQGSTVGAETTFAGFRWTSWQQPTAPLKPTTWRSDEGLLASTQSGMALPVGELSVSGYALFNADATPLATLDGGAPLVAKLNVPTGNAYVCTTLPIEPHSTMATNGIALFIAVQRSIEQGIAMLGNAIQYDAVPIVNDSDANSKLQTSSANSRNLTPVATWQPVATDERFLSSELGLHGGVYESGSKLVAVNRSSAEDIAEAITGEQFSQLLKGLDVVRIEDSAGSTKKIQQEIWRFFLILMIVALLLESLFSLPRKQAIAS